MRVTSRPEWHNARWAGILALNTTMRGCEIKNLRWLDVDLLTRVFAIRKSKTERVRGQFQLTTQLSRLSANSGKGRRHSTALSQSTFSFPLARTEHFDPTKPMKSWRSAWRQLTKAAGIPGLRFRDLRHHAITELAESQASDQTILSVAGHVSPRILALLPCSDGSEEASLGYPVQRA